ncbi:MAG: right-handed parallel beta-helix repeat-containing protein [Candidatus Phosphoribacter sp.]
MFRARSALAVIAAAVLAAVCLVASPASLATAAEDPVSAMSAPIYQVAKPTTGASLATPWRDEALIAASSYGFTTDLGVPFKASLVAVTGLMPVRRLYHPTTFDFTWALSGSTALSAALSRGYTDQGASFFASPTQVVGQTVPVNSYVKGTVRRLAPSAAGSTLLGQGWTLEGVAFHVPGVAASPPPTTTYGSAAVGTTSYAVPAGAIIAAPNGNDASPGTLAAPVRSLNRALALAPAGGTVVLRAGVYHESVTISRAVTVQSYPNEAVWLDGSSAVGGWVADGTRWRNDGWTQRFDHSPTYTQGAPDSTVPYWQFVNTATYPMAAHPDQVFIDGTALTQVKSLSLVTAGKFFLDESSSKLYIGTNPSGRAVAASTLIKAFSVRAASTVIRGIGVRRYSPSVFHMGGITVEAPSVRLENVQIEDTATTGISVLREDCTLDRVTIRRSGMLGIHSRYADRLRLLSLSVTGNNDQRFNVAPVSGGAKLGQTRGVTLSNSDFSGNFGPGFWQDLSTYNTTITGSRFTDNLGDGIFLELSAKAVVANNFVARNGLAGLKINNTSNVHIWNNTIVANVGRAVWLAQDSRRNTNPNDPAVDRRVAWPDPEMPWTLGPVTLRNNVVAQAATSASCVICNEDYSRQMTAEQMRLSLNGNLYQRVSSTSPAWLTIWSRGATNPYVFTTLASWTSTTGQESRGREFVGGESLVDAQGRLTASATALISAVALPLPADIAAIVGRPAGTVHLGKW